MSNRDKYFNSGYIGGIIGSYEIVEIKPSSCNSDNPIWVMECLCGERIEVIPSWVISNGTGKCKCGARSRRLDTDSEEYTINKLDRDRLRRLRRLLINRCYNVEYEYYKLYGERGIKVQSNWLSSLNDFIDWSANNGYRPWFYLKRISTLRGYNEENCYWGYDSSSINTTNRISKRQELNIEGLNINEGLLNKLINSGDIVDSDISGIIEVLREVYSSKSRRPLVKLRKDLYKNVKKSMNAIKSTLLIAEAINISNETEKIIRVQELLEQSIGLLALVKDDLGGENSNE